MPTNKPSGTNKNTIALVAVLVGVLVAGAITYFAWQKGQAPQAIVEPETTVTPQPVAPTPPPAPEPMQPQEPPSPMVTAKDPCQETADQLQAFFAHLDQQGYLARYGIKEKSEPHFVKLAAKLFAHPPVVVRETDDLFTILKNSAHFYRVMGKDNLLLVKDILTQKADGLETVMAQFYHWSELAPQCQERSLALQLPLSGLYEYAGFFLNTLGGQSYLFRRESRVRMLVKYYSVLIVDRANDKGLNRYGIDIRDPLRSTIEEMQVSQNLTGRDSYLDTLLDLQVKYQAR